jgi:hypothetical protein
VRSKENVNAACSMTTPHTYTHSAHTHTHTHTHWATPRVRAHFATLAPKHTTTQPQGLPSPPPKKKKKMHGQQHAPPASVRGPGSTAIDNRRGGGRVYPPLGGAPSQATPTPGSRGSPEEARATPRAAHRDSRHEGVRREGGATTTPSTTTRHWTSVPSNVSSPAGRGGEGRGRQRAGGDTAHSRQAPCAKKQEW